MMKNPISIYIPVKFILNYKENSASKDTNIAQTFTFKVNTFNATQTEC